MQNDAQDNLIEKDQIISYDDLVTMVQGFSETLQSLDYRVSNKNFGSKLYQAKETIASKGRFIAGAKDDVVIMDGQNPTYRLWAGAEDPEDAPFSVDKDGNVILNSVSLSGYIPDGGALADIGSGGITGTYIANDAITTPKIAANAITASKILVSQLSAISADIGTVTAGNINGLTITGGVIQTSSTGLRTVLDAADDNVKFMNGSTTYSAIYPYSYPQGTGIGIDAFGADISVWAGTHAGAAFSNDGAYGGSQMGIYDNTAYIIATSSIDFTGPTNIQGNGNHLTIVGNAFLRLKSMSGATADALSGAQNGAMYYRSDHVPRMMVNGAWKTITTA